MYNLKRRLQGNAKEKRTLTSDVKDLGFGENVVAKAEEIYTKINKPTRKGKRRNLQLFYCIYQAHRELEIQVDPRIIASKFGLQLGDMTKACSAFSELVTGYVPYSGFTTPTDLLPDYGKEIGLHDSMISNLVSLTEGILNDNPILLERYPQTVAAGILTYYSRMHGITIDPSLFHTIIKLSDATINSITNEIIVLDNAGGGEEVEVDN